MVQGGTSGGLKVRGSKAVDGLKGENKEFVLDAEVQGKSVERWEEWHHIGRVVREVNGFSRGILYRNEGIQVQSWKARKYTVAIIKLELTRA